MLKFDIKILEKYLSERKITRRKHPYLPIYVYKYSQETTFSREWDEITLQMRGTVLDEDGNRLSNPFPKFFNLEELEGLNIPFPKKKPWRVYDKLDGSLVEVFKYKDGVVVATGGSFESIQAQVAQKMLWEKHKEFMLNLKDGWTYLFEFIFPENKIVVDYGSEEKLVLIGVRDLDGYDFNIERFENLGFELPESYELDIDGILKKQSRPDFINKEGFVVKWADGFRVKIKYIEYLRLHKLISGVNERFVWEFLKDGKEIELENVPDEVFQFIEDTKKDLNKKYVELYERTYETFHDILNELPAVYSQKDFAIKVGHPENKKISGLLFSMHKDDMNRVKESIWKRLKPKYEKGESGFQSMKEEN